MCCWLIVLGNHAKSRLNEQLIELTDTSIIMSFIYLLFYFKETDLQLQFNMQFNYVIIYFIERSNC